MNKHVVIDARQSGTSTGRYIDKLIEHLHGLETELAITVITKRHRVEYLQSIAPGFSIIETPYAEFGLGEQVGLLRQLKGLNSDLVHFGMVQQPLLYRGPVVTTMHDLTATRFKSPTMHPLVFAIKQPIYKLINWYIPRKSAYVITPTEFVKQDIMDFARVRDSQKFVVTYESADPLPTPGEPIKKLESKQFIMFTGRPQLHKNLDRLLDAYAALKPQYPGLHLVLVGKKDELYRRYETRVNASRIPDVRFTDYVSDGQLRWLYEHCAAYIAPALSEGFGLPGLEAMKHGAPVISSNATCLPEVYGEAAHYFDPLSAEAMRDAIHDVLATPQLRNKLIHLGKEQAGKYSWHRMAKQTLEVYQSALKGRVS